MGKVRFLGSNPRTVMAIPFATSVQHVLNGYDDEPEGDVGEIDEEDLDEVYFACSDGSVVAITYEDNEACSGWSVSRLFDGRGEFEIEKWADARGHADDNTDWAMLSGVYWIVCCGGDRGMALKLAKFTLEESKLDGIPWTMNKARGVLEALVDDADFSRRLWDDSGYAYRARLLWKIVEAL